MELDEKVFVALAFRDENPALQGQVPQIVKRFFDTAFEDVASLVPEHLRGDCQRNVVAADDMKGFFQQMEAQQPDKRFIDGIDPEPRDLGVGNEAVTFVQHGVCAVGDRQRDLCRVIGDEKISAADFMRLEDDGVDLGDDRFGHQRRTGQREEVLQPHPTELPAFLGASGRISDRPFSSFAASSMPSESMPMSLAGLRFATTQTWVPTRVSAA